MGLSLPRLRLFDQKEENGRLNTQYAAAISRNKRLIPSPQKIMDDRLPIRFYGIESKEKRRFIYTEKGIKNLSTLLILKRLPLSTRGSTTKRKSHSFS